MAYSGSVGSASPALSSTHEEDGIGARPSAFVSLGGNSLPMSPTSLVSRTLALNGVVSAEGRTRHAIVGWEEAERRCLVETYRIQFHLIAQQYDRISREEMEGIERELMSREAALEQQGIELNALQQHVSAQEEDLQNTLSQLRFERGRVKDLTQRLEESEKEREHLFSREPPAAVSPPRSSVVWPEIAVIPTTYVLGWMVSFEDAIRTHYLKLWEGERRHWLYLEHSLQSALLTTRAQLNNSGSRHNSVSLREPHSLPPSLPARVISSQTIVASHPSPVLVASHTIVPPVIPPLTLGTTGGYSAIDPYAQPYQSLLPASRSRDSCSTTGSSVQKSLPSPATSVRMYAGISERTQLQLAPRSPRAGMYGAPSQPTTHPASYRLTGGQPIRRTPSSTLDSRGGATTRSSSAGTSRRPPPPSKDKAERALRLQRWSREAEAERHKPQPPPPPAPEMTMETYVVPSLPVLPAITEVVEVIEAPVISTTVEYYVDTNMYIMPMQAPPTLTISALEYLPPSDYLPPPDYSPPALSTQAWSGRGVSRAGPRRHSAPATARPIKRQPELPMPVEAPVEEPPDVLTI